MQEIKNWFENDAVNSGEHYDFLEYEGHLEVRTETTIFIDGRIQRLLNSFLIQILNCAIICMIISSIFTKDY